MKKLKLKEMVRSLVLPMLLLVGLVLASATTVSAQDFKSAADAKVIVKAQADAATDLLPTSVYTERQSQGELALTSVKARYYSYLYRALNNGDTELAFQETYGRMESYYTTAAQVTLLNQVNDEALSLITE